ncbi:nuclear transport factor 2 family protein [Rheinheimera sp.]|uniref:YybH family protein n=1 Tax=Rheinheimera sp. TaxID=1869214 RepID=UPI00307F67CD
MKALLMVLLLSSQLLFAQTPLQQAQQQVFAAERAFAKSMADRDIHAFEQYLADDAVFFGQSMLRGKAQVVAGWAGLFNGEQPPFSWEPEQVEVSADGILAHSSGPVKSPDGNVIATFNSVWRQTAPGVWKVQFDKGCERCGCKTTAQAD